LLPFCLPGTSWAQHSVWQGGKEKMNDLKAKGRKQESKFRQWKKYIEDWGLDPNYNYSLALGARLNTNGWSGGIYYQKQLSAGKHVLWELHFSEIKHEKETKQENNAAPVPGLGKYTPFIFGKINNVYTLQLGYGRQQMLLPALLDGNLSVGFRYAVGPALALLKPYYLDVITTQYKPDYKIYEESERYDANNPGSFLKAANILGAAKWSKGLKETKFVPGLFGELAFVLEPDKPKAFVKTITIGGNAAFYAKPLEIMADRKAYRYQLSLFVGLAVGKRWK
jgi:hypothetical protein